MASRLTRVTALLSVVTAGLLLASPARAHWCDDNWGSSYNLVVRPAQDSVTVPGSGSVTLDVYVQNNIGEALKNFNLNATASGYTIAMAAQNGVRPGWLMPGEKLKYTLTISRSGGGTLGVDSLTFTVSFGDGGQSSGYGSLGRDVVVKKTDGSLLPAGPGTGWTGINQGASDAKQSRHLQHSAFADYGDLAGGLDQLLQLYCAGRRSWDGSGGTYTAGACDTTTYVPATCPTRSVGGSASKYDYQQLWGAQELASRRSALAANKLAAFRSRLKCGYSSAGSTHTASTVDPIPTFRHFALFLLGYLGADDDARAYLLNVIASGPTADDKDVAKAALLLHGNAADRTSYHASVAANLTSSNFHVSAASAAALGIVDVDDAAVTAQLIPKSDWIEPDTADNGKALYAAHLLMLVSWHRRGYRAGAGDICDPSYYGQAAPDTTPPEVAGGVSCTSLAGGGIRVSWNQVSTDTSGGAEKIVEYRVYSGTAARTSGCTDPGCATDYAHYDAVNSTSFSRDFVGLDGTQTYYFAVMAVDCAQNRSHYSVEAHCTPVFPPTAVISCDRTSGTVPLDVTCNASGSNDPNGAADIVSRTFSLDGQAPQSGNTVSYSFTSAANHVVVLRVTDAGGLFATDQATITVTDAGNTAPTAVAGATPLGGQAPLQVSFSSAGSSDPDSGQTLSYAWDFKDGNTSTEASPTHTFTAAGAYDVLLTVTDDAPTPASGFAVVSVNVLGNRAPDVSTASANPLFGPVPLTVHFDASSVTDPDGNAVSVVWDFGDGSAASSELTVDHVYSAVGAVTAHLAASDDYSPPATATRSFVINPGGGPLDNRAPDCAAAAVTPAAGGAPLTVTLDASGCVDPEGNGMTFLWRIPTSLVTEDQVDTASGTYVFEQDGEVTITLRVTDDGTPSMSTSREFVVTVGAGGGRAPLSGCVCLAAGGAPRGVPAWIALVGAALARGWRRRRW